MRLRDRHGGGTAGKMTWQRYHDRRKGIGRRRVVEGSEIGREETDAPDFGVDDGPGGASRVHGSNV